MDKCANLRVEQKLIVFILLLIRRLTNLDQFDLSGQVKVTFLPVSNK